MQDERKIELIYDLYITSDPSSDANTELFHPWTFAISGCSRLITIMMLQPDYSVALHVLGGSGLAAEVATLRKGLK